MIVWAAVYLTWGLGLRPTWRGYGGTVAITLVWLVRCSRSTSWPAPTTATSTQAGTATILDYLGPWPRYVAVEIALVAIVWALMTLPCAVPSPCGP